MCLLLFCLSACLQASRVLLVPNACPKHSSVVSKYSTRVEARVVVWPLGAARETTVLLSSATMGEFRALKTSVLGCCLSFVICVLCLDD